jgi:transporter family protein
MSWIAATLVSAFFLGCYDLCTKHAVRENAVLPVLFLANLCSATIWLTLMAVATFAPASFAFPAALSVAALSASQHGLLAAKSLLVGCSWLCGYFAVKHLPVSLASPIRATGPVWTLFGALLVLGERPSWLEMLGIAITLASFLGLSVVGAR